LKAPMASAEEDRVTAEAMDGRRRARLELEDV
jgi:hypothetical protein